MRRVRVKQLGFLIFVLLGIASNVSAEQGSQLPRNVQFSNLDTESGFSSEFVHDVAQDKLGFMWFATQAGLNRFDGHKVRVFEHFPDDTNSISHNFVWDIYPGDNDEIWLATYDGLIDFKPDGSFTRYTPSDGLSSEKIRVLRFDNEGTLWIGTGKGLNRMKDGKISQVTEETHLQNGFIMSLFVDRKGRLWVGTDGAGVFIRENGQFKQYTTQEGLASDVVFQISEDKNGVVLQDFVP